MPELTKEELKSVQVIENLSDDSVRVYEVVAMHIGDDDDPLTTVVIEGL